MVINKNGRLTDIDGANYWENSRYSVWWEGIVFVKSFPAGKASIKYFIRTIEKNDISSSCNILSGSFSCILLDKKKGKYYAFVDNSRTSYLYYDQNYISTSFLNLIDRTKKRLNDIDQRSIVEFIITGSVFTEKIFFKDIKIISADEILVVSVGGRNISITHKSLSDIYQCKVPKYYFLQSLCDVASSLKNNKMSIDLTGGSDTRLLALIFKRAGLDFETAISGMLNHPDVEISQKVAKMLGTKHYITYHRADHIDLIYELKETFVNSDGLSDVLNIHRLYQFDRDRAKRGVALAIGGGAGELYKDGGWWRIAMQSLKSPIWNKYIVEKLVNTGLAGWGFNPELPSFLFTSEYRTICLRYKEYLIEYLLRNYNANSRFKMADKIFYEYSVRSPRGISHGMVKYYSPLLDRQIVPMGINMGQRRRFLSMCYRNIISSLDKNIARMDTTKASTSLSSELNYVSKDLKKLFVYEIGKKLRRSHKQAEKQDAAIFTLTRKMKETHFYIDSLKEIGMLNYMLSSDDIPDKYLGRLITLGKLIERLN